MKKKAEKSAFTLAEVLITLGIIGIVAAMTIPTLVASYKKTQYVVALKKVYSQVNQALTMMTNDSGTPGDLKGTGLFSAGTDNESLGKEFIKYIKASKTCSTATKIDCWAAKTYDYFDGKHNDNFTEFNSTSRYKFVTADGMSVSLWNYAAIDPSYADCALNSSSGKTGNLKQICGLLYVDVNGLNGPNTWGRDTFVFYISNGKGAVLYPMGGAEDTSIGGDYWGNTPGSCNSTVTFSQYCTGRIFEQNWEMNY